VQSSTQNDRYANLKVIRCYLTATNLTPHWPKFPFLFRSLFVKIFTFALVAVRFGLKFSWRTQSFGHLNEAEGAENIKNGSEDDDAGATEEAPFSVLKMLMIRFLWPLRASFSSGSGGFELGGGARVGPFFGNLHGFAKWGSLRAGPMKKWLTGIFHLFWGSLEVLYRMTVKLPVSFRIFTVIRPSSLPVKKMNNLMK
jgi:hypothetical protein